MCKLYSLLVFKRVVLMKYGYARVSSIVQLKGNSLEEQTKELLDAGVNTENIILEQCSGKSAERPKFKELLSKLSPGDELVCCKLDRFARNAEDGLRIVRELSERDITVNILNIGRIDTSAAGKLLLTVMLAFAEFERTMILERTAAGKAIAKTKAGYREGRPPVNPLVIAHALELLETHSYNEVCSMTKVSKSTLQRYAKKKHDEEVAHLKEIPRKSGSQGPEDELSLWKFHPNKRPGRPKKSDQ